MGRSLFLVGLDVNDAVLIKSHHGIINVSAFFSGVEENDSHRWTFFKYFYHVIPSEPAARREPFDQLLQARAPFQGLNQTMAPGQGPSGPIATPDQKG